MTTQPATVSSARAFTEAWTRLVMDTTSRYLTDDVVFDGPLGHVEGKSEYLDSLKRLVGAMGITGVEILAAFGDDAQVLIMYTLKTTAYGDLTCAKLLSFHDGKIARDTLTFDSYKVRQG